MRQLILLAIHLLLVPVISKAGTYIVENDNINGSDDYESVTISISSLNSIVIVIGNDYGFSLMGPAFNDIVDITVGTTPYHIDNFKMRRIITQLAVGSISNNHGMVLEVRDTSNTTAHGLLYMSSGTSTSISSTFQDSIDDATDDVYYIIDSVHTSNGDNISPSPPSAPSSIIVGQNAYLLSFDLDSQYASGYTLQELTYEFVYNTSSTNRLEKILDIDRGNELVGFRYYSNFNDEEYTLFIKPNN